MEKIRIIIYGNTGVGKTTVCEEMRREYKSIKIKSVRSEKNENIMKYYEDIRRGEKNSKYFSKSQKYFLEERRRIDKEEEEEEIIIYDRSIYDSTEVYIKYGIMEGYCPGEEIGEMEKMCEEYREEMKDKYKDCIYVYLYGEVSKIKKRIEGRDREMDRGTRERMIEGINKLYDRMYERIRGEGKRNERIDTTEMTREEVRERMREIIEKEKNEKKDVYEKEKNREIKKDKMENNKGMRYEEILDKERIRYNVSKIEYEDFWYYYKKQQDAYWRAEEIEYAYDKQHYEELGKNEQNVIKMILAFFASSDGIVNLNLRERFMNDIVPIEAQMAYGFQSMMENVHNEVYSKLLNTIITDKEERERLFNAIKTVPVIKKMSDWAIKWTESDDEIGSRLIAFAIVEGIMFCGAFALIFWIKSFIKEGKLPGLIGSNEFISRDESIHTEFACCLFRHLKNKTDQKKYHKILKEGVELSIEFVKEVIVRDLIAISEKKMCDYIKYTSNMLSYNLGYESLYPDIKESPFEWMSNISIVAKTNFFEKRPTSYQSANSKFNDGTTDLLLDDF